MREGLLSRRYEPHTEMSDTIGPILVWGGSAMELFKITLLFAASIPPALASAQNQTTDKPAPKVLVCNESAGCSHEFIDGHKFKTMTSDGLTVTVSMMAIGKYIRADVTVMNGTTATVDVLPTDFECDESVPKQKKLAYVDAEKIIRSAQNRVALGNALTAMGASMSRQQSTTTTTSIGTVRATDSDGTYTTGTYHGSSVSTTSAPDPAAQARADETIRQRNAAMAALNGQLSHTILKANSISHNQSIRGIVLFERDKKAESVSLSVPVAGVSFEFPFVFLHQ